MHNLSKLGDREEDINKECRKRDMTNKNTTNSNNMELPRISRLRKRDVIILSKQSITWEVHNKEKIVY